MIGANHSPGGSVARADDPTTPALVIGPTHRAVDLIAVHKPSHVVACFSPGQEPPADPGAAVDRLELCFHDLAEVRDGFVAPGTDLVGTLLDFARTWTGTRPLLIHCWAGVSRSSAAAYIVACDRNPGCERAIAAELRQRAPFATPNPLMVRLADGMLTRRGRMIAAIAAIGRGAEATWGEPFCLPAGDYGSPL
jgi:predicted protein tyrosine phosphatase